MGTGIWSATIIIGSGTQNIRMERRPVKRLPLNILLSDASFLKGLKIKAGEAAWKKLPKNKETGEPDIRIEYSSYLGDVAEEPSLPV